MSYENEKDKPDIATGFNDMQRTLNTFDLGEIKMAIEYYKSKLVECRNDYQSTEMEIFNVNHMANKGLFILKDMEIKYKDLEVELDKVHCEYIKCVQNVNNYEETVHQKVNSLTLKRDNLKKELTDLKNVADENDKKLIEIRNMITVQEKKNIALLRKLKKIVERTSITPDLKGRANAILSDPRVTKRF
ncbi:uncharacterized protein LOC128873448 [Hylaeus volcanicus]|uniref:uncharacterized protein LOC128873448 n=1 Tax=Hylaeus volcanicus TaxID=313075 RepID=UPI0023B83A8F|nr:uncharacterized protein LOC128873448 [Hylaeus volcanicus]